jgi:hypothetical protein
VLFEVIFVFLFQEYTLEGVLGFIRRNAKIAGTMPKRLHDTNAAPHGLQHNPQQPNNKDSPCTVLRHEWWEGDTPSSQTMSRPKKKTPGADSAKDGTTNATAHP